MGGVKRADQLRSNQQIMKPDGRLLEACEDLRYAVEHPNERSEIIEQQGIYRQKDPEAIMVVKVDGVEVGYEVKPSSALEMSPYFDRYVYVKVPGHRLRDLSKVEMSAIKTALLEAFFEVQQGRIQMEVIGWDAMLIRQRFMVAFPVERSPGLVSIAGGMNA
jgi:hypothetical protein